MTECCSGYRPAIPVASRKAVFCMAAPQYLLLAATLCLVLWYHNTSFVKQFFTFYLFFNLLPYHQLQPYFDPFAVLLDPPGNRSVGGGGFHQLETHLPDPVTCYTNLLLLVHDGVVGTILQRTGSQSLRAALDHQPQHKGVQFPDFHLSLVRDAGAPNQTATEQ